MDWHPIRGVSCAACKKFQNKLLEDSWIVVLSHCDCGEGVMGNQVFLCHHHHQESGNCYKYVQLPTALLRLCRLSKWAGGICTARSAQVRMTTIRLKVPSSMKNDDWFITISAKLAENAPDALSVADSASSCSFRNTAVQIPAAETSQKASGGMNSRAGEQQLGRICGWTSMSTWVFNLHRTVIFRVK